MKVGDYRKNFDIILTGSVSVLIPKILQLK